MLCGKDRILCTCLVPPILVREHFQVTDTGSLNEVFWVLRYLGACFYTERDSGESRFSYYVERVVDTALCVTKAFVGVFFGGI